MSCMYRMSCLRRSSYYGGEEVAEMIFSYYDVLARAYRDAPTINSTWPPIAARNFL